MSWPSASKTLVAVRAVARPGGDAGPPCELAEADNPVTELAVEPQAVISKAAQASVAPATARRARREFIVLIDPNLSMFTQWLGEPEYILGGSVSPDKYDAGRAAVVGTGYEEGCHLRPFGIKI